MKKDNLVETDFWKEGIEESTILPTRKVLEQVKVTAQDSIT